MAQMVMAAGVDAARDADVELADLVVEVAGADIGRDFLRDGDEDKGELGDAFTRLAAERRSVLAQALGDVKRLATGAAVRSARFRRLPGTGDFRPLERAAESPRIMT